MRTAAIVVLGVVPLATAQPVTAIPLAPGTQGPFFAPHIDSQAPASTAVSWLTLTLPSAARIDVDINRTTPQPDLVALLFAGDVNGVDATALSVTGTLVAFFFSPEDGVFGPLTSLQFADDTEPNDLGGPFGDPRFTLTVDAGTYTFLVATLQPITGGSFTVTTTIEPASCNPADFAEAFGTLDINDILEFANLFNATDPAADLFADGMYDINDVLTFAAAFNTGCP